MNVPLRVCRIVSDFIVTALVGALAGSAAEAQYPGWQHSGSVHVLTTPDGANLPAVASEENFPLLVRLNKEFFNFGQARPNGEDIRFSDSTGTPLAYQIEEWDAANGTASVWVRIPTIKGNARQEIKLHWGKSDATSESNGAAVFNESHGFVSVCHMDEPVKDEVGTVVPTNAGTTAAPGIIGSCRHLGGGQGIFGGDKIANYPTGASAHSTEAWFRAEKPNATIVAWGNEEAQGKVVMQLVSPPHINMDCYFSGANVRSAGRLPMTQWVHVVHTYTKGEARLYVNGVLDGSNSGGTPLAIKSPAKMWIGGWYNNYQFVGDIDEVRISKVVRSADWVRLEYENQKPVQTLVGPVVQTGDVFTVSPSQLTVPEGQSATVTAQAGGAQKVYWILKRGGRENVVAVDRFAYPFAAGRVVGDQAATLQFKAVYANETKTKDIAITIEEAISEPVVALKAPAAWNGRDPIEIVPAVNNRVGELHYTWTVAGGAVIKEVLPGKLLLKRAQYTGPITVKLAVNNGGADSVATATIRVTEPKKDPWVRRAPDSDEKPEDDQFYARDDKNEGRLFYNGTLTGPGNTVFLKVYAGDKLYKAETRKLLADKSYAFTVKLKPGLIKYRVEFGTGAQVLHSVTNLVCGDAYIIEGQSNALATDTGEQSPPETSEWIRSYGKPQGNGKGERPNLWCNPVWKARQGEKAELGYWGMELAKRLVESQKIPICIINGAVGGTRIDQHQRNPANPEDLTTIYGRLLWRVRQARLTHGIRGILWHQGESDQGADGPTGGYGWETYQQYFIDMSAGWKQDYPNVQHYYIFQIWPRACAMGVNGSDNRLREVQRTLPALYSHMSIMSTLGIKPPGGCHYPLTGWAEFARLIQPLIERDFYGKVPTTSITPPNLIRASYASADTIKLELDQPVVWNDSLTNQFYLDGAADQVASGIVSGNVLTLKLKTSATAQHITYLDSRSWKETNLLYGANGIAALTFCNVPIANAKGP